MSKYHGKDARLYIAGYDISSLMASVTPAQEIEMAQYAVADGVSGYHNIRGLTKDALSLDGLFDDNYQTVLNNLFAASSGYQIMIPLGTTIEDRVLAIDEAKLNKYNWKAIVNDVNRLTGEFVAEDLPWDECILAFPKATKTSDGNHTGIDDGAQTTDGMVAYLQVFACGGDDALIVTIEDDDNDSFSSPNTLITFTTANGITTERKTASGTIQRYVRVTWSGTPTYSATFAVAYKRL